jgi:predicted transcriptional regulator
MTSVDDHPFSGQYSTLRDLEDRATDVAKDLLGEKSQNSEDSLEYKLPLLKKNAVKTLYIIAEAYPNTTQATEIEKKSGFHRSTVSVHTRELGDLDLIDQQILRGTENKYKPTHLYRLKPGADPDADREQIRRFFEAYVQKDPSLVVDPENEPEEDSSVSDDLGNPWNDEAQPWQEPKLNEPESVPDSLNVIDTEPELSPELSNEEDAEEPTFEEKVAAIINEMAQEIVSLRERVSDLEQKLHQKSRHAGQVDLSQAMSLLNSPKGGTRKS